MATVTINGNPYPIYGTAAGADAYLVADFNLSGAWATLGTERRKQALVTVARNFDAKAWRGAKVADGQELAWPRTGTFGSPPTEQVNVTPQIIIDASYLLAGLLAKNPGILNRGSSRPPLQSLREGGTSASFFFQAKDNSVGSVEEVDALLAAYLGTDDQSLGDLMVGQVSGTDGVSAFCETNETVLS